MDPQGHRHTGNIVEPEHLRSSGTQAHRHAGTQARRYAGTQGTQARRHAGMQARSMQDATVTHEHAFVSLNVSVSQGFNFIQDSNTKIVHLELWMLSG